uniref:Haemolymph juvenile hormone binding protein n=1 Tax=Glossina brevipalpis TaxID=37001 RepID=A0A1A9WGV7_9MUSC
MLRLPLIIGLIGSMCAFLKAEFPNDPKPCNYGDSECDNSINMLSIDPLITDKIRINQGAENPVNIDITFSNSKVYGLSTSVAHDIKGFGKDLKTKHEIFFKVPGSISLIGDYIVKGKVLILPLQGEGKSNMTLVEPECRISFIGGSVEKDGNIYMKPEKFHMHVNIKRSIYNFENLFNGDKALGDNMNKFLNENWKDIFDETKDSISKEFGVVVKHVIEQVFAKYPYAKYFNA